MPAPAQAWERLRGFLDALSLPGTTAPVGARVGATLALLAERDGDIEIVYTRRRDDLANHPGQISFPGGRVDPGETLVAAAVREAAEEVALDPSSAVVLGALPPFYIPPSRFWLQTVVARWERPHPLVPAEAEVAEVIHTPLGLLTDPARWRVVWLSAGGWTWAWQLDPRHVLWGATAAVTAVLLDALAPGWNGDIAPEDLAADRVARPWLDLPAGARRPRPGRLAGVPQRPARAEAAGGPRGWPSAKALEAVAAATAQAVGRFRAASPVGRVLVLAGTGGNGAAGLAAARRLADTGIDVHVVMSGPPRREIRPLAAGLDVGVFDSALPAADLVIDALVGGGLRGPLAGGPREVLLALRQRYVPVVSLDVPSGLHPVEGLVGDLVAADVTLAIGAARAGLFRAGLAPFVGDLYVTADGPAHIVRLLRTPVTGHGWRE